MSTDYKNTLNWNTSPELDEIFSQSFVYDAMNRPMELTKPDGTIEQYTYNKAGLLETVKAQVRSEDWVFAVTNINYNEKGQRTDIYYGNGTRTKYTYDPLTFRLTELFTTRNGSSDELQKISYTYDPVGNITQVTDGAQQTHYFNNTATTASGIYTYDALYRLKTATGRELTSLQMPSQSDFTNNIPVPNTAANAMQMYTQRFQYDELGNMMQMKSDGNWTKDYVYETINNRLKKHDTEQTVDDYTYDEHGNMLSMPHLASMLWDYKDELKEVDLGGGGTAYYVYDAGGERVRKVIEKTGGIVEERIYLGAYEVYRKSLVGTLQFERETLHVSDNEKKIVSIETKTVEAGNVLSSPISNIRYQYDNHLGSAALELDDTAAIISYEEYHPFGTTSYRSGRTETEVSLKRYKYVGKERDDETGLYYYGARYYAAWIARFVSVDPLQFDYPQLTPYNYAGNKPITHIDIDGMQSSGDEKITTQPRYSEQRDDDGNLLSRTKEQSSLTLNDDGSATVHNLKGTVKYNDDGTTSTFVEPYSETVNNSDELSDKGKEYLNLISNYAAEGTKGFIKSQGFNFAETGFSKYNPRQDYFNKLAPLKENLIKGKLSKENYSWARYQAQRSVRSKSSTYGKLIAEVAKTSKQQQQHAHDISRELKEFPKNAQGTRKSINTLAKYSKSIFRGLTVLSASLSVYDVITSPDPNKAAAQELSGWAGATMGSLSGAKIGFTVGALFGGVGAPIGAIIGGIAGGAIGYWAGAKAGNAAYGKLNH